MHQQGRPSQKKLLAGDPRLAKLRVQFDPDRARPDPPGDPLAESSWRSLADRKLATLWFVAAVENPVETPTFAKGQLARIWRQLAGPVRSDHPARTLVRRDSA